VAAATVAQTPSPLDVNSLLAAFDNDARLLADVAGLFVADAPELLAAMRQAIAGGDSDALMQAAHNLKGMLRSFQADGPAQSALDLEKMGKSAALEGSQALVDVLEKDIENLSRVLEKLMDTVNGT
jgi:HPt (histidine-containing phosphotransfer) domain-containing protein